MSFFYNHKLFVIQKEDFCDLKKNVFNVWFIKTMFLIFIIRSYKKNVYLGIDNSITKVMKKTKEK